MRWTGSLYWATEENETEHHFIANFDVEAKIRRDAMKLILDAEWDDRLDGASCYPVFKWGKIQNPVAVYVSLAEAIEIGRKVNKLLKQNTAEILEQVEKVHGTGSVLLALVRLATANVVRLATHECPSGELCVLCDEVIQDDEAAIKSRGDPGTLRLDDEWAHLSCSVTDQDGQDIDRDCGDR